MKKNLLERTINRTFELFALLFFKSITIIGTVSSVYMLLNFIKPTEVNTDIYVGIGIALGAIIAFYITPHFSKSNDTEGLIVAILAISFISYLPSSAVIYKWIEAKAVETITIPKPNYTAYNQAKSELDSLVKKRAEYLNEPLLQKQKFLQTKESFISLRLNELKNFHYVVKDGEILLDKKGNKRIRWGKQGYGRYKSAMSGFETERAEAEYRFEQKAKEFDALAETRKADSYLVNLITTQKAKVEELSPKAYEDAVEAKKRGVPNFYLVAFLTLILGIVVESLGELPYWLKLRKQSIQPRKEEESQEEAKQEPTKEPTVFPMLPYYNNTATTRVAKKPTVLELNEENLLRERFRDVNVGESLNAKNTLPFEQNSKLTRALASLNKKLKEGGYITDSTHPKALKSYSEAKEFIKRVA